MTAPRAYPCHKTLTHPDCKYTIQKIHFEPQKQANVSLSMEKNQIQKSNTKTSIKSAPKIQYHNQNVYTQSTNNTRENLSKKF